MLSYHSCYPAGGDGDFFHISQGTATIQELIRFGLLNPKDRMTLSRPPSMKGDAGARVDSMNGSTTGSATPSSTLQAAPVSRRWGGGA